MKVKHFFFAAALFGTYAVQAQKDSTTVLDSVAVMEVKSRQVESSALPFLELNRKALEQLNAKTIGEAARFLPGVQIKDYGGAGGLKTISVRSLGATHTGLLYDGLPVADMQAGQIDLGRYSKSFIQSVVLYQANPSETLLPARAYASSSVLGIYSRSFYPAIIASNEYTLGLKAGSFGYKQFTGGGVVILPKAWQLHASTELTGSKGNYPFMLHNGNYSERKRRTNGELETAQGELNLVKKINEDTGFQLKSRGEYSLRGLPGAIRFYNDRSVQSLTNRDFYVQLRYHSKIFENTRIMFLGKYNHAFTNYRDPDFLNNIGGINDRYKQNEKYLSMAIDHSFSSGLSAGFASDISSVDLWSDRTNFTFPKRISSWNNFRINYEDSLWKVNFSLLYSAFTDDSDNTAIKESKNSFSPTIAISRKILASSPVIVRAYYKQSYRMPNFNELYYTILGVAHLDPETAKQWNIGLAYDKIIRKKLTRLSFSVDAYYNWVNDKIIAAPGINLFSWTMLNLGKVEIKGVDMTAEAAGMLSEYLHWNARVSYTWQNAMDITDPNSSRYKDRIPYSPDHSGTAMVSMDFRQWSMGLTGMFSGTRYTLGENNPFNQLDGFGTTDIYLSRKMDISFVKINIRLELNNLFNKQYDVIRYFPMPGRNYLISLQFNF